jgi:60kDa lysophospholipase
VCFMQILTGAQIPLSQLRNDAVENLLGALSIAGQYVIPGTLIICDYFLPLLYQIECSLFFNHRLFRGNRVSKSSSTDYDAFSSPNFTPLVNGKFDCLPVMYPLTNLK